MSGDGVVKLTFYMPEALRHRLRLVAAHRDDNMSAIVQTAIERHLEELEQACDHTEEDRARSAS